MSLSPVGIFGLERSLICERLGGKESHIKQNEQKREMKKNSNFLNVHN